MLILHWFTLMWYTLVSRQAPDNRVSNNVWLPSNYRIIASSSNLDEDTLAVDFYSNNYEKADIYIYTFYSMMMSILGGEVAPVEPEQALVASSITFLGQMTIAFIFA